MRSDYHFSTHELRFFEVKYITIGPSRLSTMRNMLGQFGREVLSYHLVRRAVVPLHWTGTWVAVYCIFDISGFRRNVNVVALGREKWLIE